MNASPDPAETPTSAQPEPLSLATLSEREQRMLLIATDDAHDLFWEDERDLDEFLDRPIGEPMPRTIGGRTLSVVNVILAARSRGEHIL